MAPSSAPILVHVPHALGDAVIATGTVSSLAARQPGRAIDVLGNAVAARVFAGHPGVRRTHVYAAGAPVTTRVRKARALAAERYAASITLPPSFSAVLVARAAAAKTRVGFDGPLRGLGFNARVQRARRGSIHLSDDYATLIETLGGVVAGPLAQPSVRVQAPGAHSTDVPYADVPYMVVAPGATYGPAKEWSSARFAKACRTLADPRCWSVVVVGAAGDRVACRTVAGSVGERAVNRCGETSIDELAAILAGAQLVLANDSGTMHLAAAVGAPVVGIFGSSEPAWTAPATGSAVTCEPRPPCAPCYRRTCSIGYVCLEELAVEQVVDSAEDLLATRAS